MLNKVLLDTILLLLLVSPCRAEPDEFATLRAELQQASAATASLQSDFVQEKHLSIFAEKLISRGRFLYRKPDHLRWELLTPVRSGFILQGRQGVRWNALSREQSEFSVDQAPVMGLIAQQLLAWARVDLDWLQQRYRMELLTSEPVALKLTPLDPGEADFIAYLRIQFAADRSHVAEVLMVEQGGDSTLLRFDNVQLNVDLPANAFHAPEL